VNGEIREFDVDPQALGLRRCEPEELRGGSPSENAAVIRAVFSGKEQGAKRDAILLNAAGAIAAGGHADDLRDGLEIARGVVDSGAAAERLEALIAFSRSHG
jgi:anthranilate phosphoribosyltransferase